jgi:hypothetical protein
MKSSKQWIPIFAATTLFLTAAAQAAHVDMKDPRRALGREDDIRVDAQLFQDTVSNSSGLNVTYQIQNLTASPIAVADRIASVSYDQDDATITLTIGAEIPGENMPHLVVIAPGAKKTLTSGGVFSALVPKGRLARTPQYFQVRVNVLRDITPFRDLIVRQSAQTAAAVALPATLFDKWLDASDTIECNAIPVRWSAGGGPKEVPTAEQRSPTVGTW